MEASGRGIAARASFASDFAKLQQSRLYDLFMRLPLLGWAMFCATLQMAGLARYVREADAALPFAAYAVNMAMRLSTIAFLLLLGASVALRARPTSKARGLQPRITAFVGAFLVYTIPFFPRRELSVTAEMVSTLLVLFGSAAAVYALVRLGRSFSMMAEARRLVTSGPYRFVRHPRSSAFRYNSSPPRRRLSSPCRSFSSCGGCTTRRRSSPKPSRNTLPTGKGPPASCPGSIEL